LHKPEALPLQRRLRAGEVVAGEVVAGEVVAAAEVEAARRTPLQPVRRT
jgi:hypothetical protein